MCDGSSWVPFNHQLSAADTDPSMKINRLRQVYIAETEHNYVPIEERG
jgi:hypothetical protein